MANLPSRLASAVGRPVAGISALLTDCKAPGSLCGEGSRVGNRCSGCKPLTTAHASAAVKELGASEWVVLASKCKFSVRGSTACAPHGQPCLVTMHVREAGIVQWRSSYPFFASTSTNLQAAPSGLPSLLSRNCVNAMGLGINGQGLLTLPYQAVHGGEHPQPFSTTTFHRKGS
jgi:hypothetical protein